MIKACIFNLEGVILDVQPLLGEALQQFAPRYGWNLDTEGVEEVDRYGRQRQQWLASLFQRAGASLSPDQLSAVQEEVSRQMERRMAELGPDDLLDGVAVFIKELKNRGLSLAVVSPYPNTRRLLNRLQITHLFHALVEGPGACWEPIPPATYLQAAREMNFQPDQCIVFDPSRDNIAPLTDFFVVGVGRADDLQADADLVIPDFHSLRFRKIMGALGGEMPPEES